MAEPKVTTGFELYETLRYFLPGFLLAFLSAYVAFPDPADRPTLAELVAGGVLIGFIAHSFGMYKCIPGATRIRKEFHQKVGELLDGVDDVYVRWDTVLLMMTADRRQHCRKYFALGAFKLDMSFAGIIFLTCYAVSAFQSMLRANELRAPPIVAISLMAAGIWIVSDDGLNDLRRAFNVALVGLLALPEECDLKQTLRLIEGHEAKLIAGERRFVHPVESLWTAVTCVPRWLLESVRLTRDPP